MNTQLEQKMSWVYLINLVFFFIPFFTVTFKAWQYLSMAAALLLFLVCYFKAYRSSFAQMHWPVLGIIAVAALITPVNPGSISMFAYAGFFIAFAYPMRQYLWFISGVILLLLALELSLNLHWPYFLHFGIPVLLGVSLFGRVERQRLLHQRAERQSADEIKQLATQVERERIGRDLHDILGHTLSSIVLKAELAARLLDKQQAEAARVQLAELSQIARDSLSQVRQSVSGYKHQGLTAEVSKLLSRLRDGGFAAELQGDIPTLDQRSETALILVLTELITNVLRHSNGNSCHILFKQQGRNLLVSVADNGNVFAVTAGNGINGITERLAALNAALVLNTDQGCDVQITLPLTQGHPA
jgi:two-component system, NarL family, sensor histidine kinase DesK